MIDYIEKELFARQDLKYRDFQAKLMPTVDKATVIGVRTPELRALAKELGKRDDVDEFLQALPHRYYEENNLHAFLIEQIKDFDECIKELEIFLPYIDNWATCDGMRPKCFAKNRDKLYAYAERWMASKHTYTVRYGILMLMTYYLDDAFDKSNLQKVANISSGEYYVNMMIAWYFATALAKQYDDTVIYLVDNKLSLWVHNKAIQKAIESYRITAEQKIFLKQLVKTHKKCACNLFITV